MEWACSLKTYRSIEFNTDDIFCVSTGACLFDYIICVLISMEKYKKKSFP